MKHKFPYRWTLRDAAFTKDKGKVFSCFACGGGSTVGYKLAGYDVIGCNEIDPRVMKLYETNHKPRHAFLGPIQEFKERTDLPDELYQLDVLDGSPPCSSFSVAGDREKAWGKMKHFREGQAEQVLDTLFFDFIDLAKKLQPKVVIAENVKGLLLGEAIKYVRRIYDGFEDAGYYCQHFLLDASKMGVPQRRERVFFVCLRKDIAEPFLVPDGLFRMKPEINMEFNEEPILMKEIADYSGREVKSGKMRLLWDNRKYGEDNQSAANERLFGKHSNFGQAYVYPDKVCPTLTTSGAFIHFGEPRFLGRLEVYRASSFPEDYDFAEQPPQYVCGMSVPPVMMAQVASRVYEQWLSKL